MAELRERPQPVDRRAVDSLRVARRAGLVLLPRGDEGGAGELSAAMRLIGDEGRGVVVLFRDLEKTLPAQGEVSPHVLRQYGLGAQILSSLGLCELIVLTNSAPVKVVGLDAYGLSIHSTRPIPKG